MLLSPVMIGYFGDLFKPKYFTKIKRILPVLTLSYNVIIILNKLT